MDDGSRAAGPTGLRIVQPEAAAAKAGGQARHARGAAAGYDLLRTRPAGHSHQADVRRSPDPVRETGGPGKGFGSNGISMKSTITRGWKWLLGALMGLLGFEGCDLIGFGRCEYGEPHADYKLIGDVKNKHGNPIPGIRVVYDRAPELEFLGKDTLYTDRNGHIEKDLPDYHWVNGTVIRFEDVDGAENGSYKTKILTEEEFAVEQTQKGDKKWYEGAFTVHADAVLEEEK